MEKEKIESKEEYRPRYLQQTKLIQELTGRDEQDILDTAKKDYMADWLLNYVSKYFEETEEDILSPRKFRSLVLVRGVYSYFMKKKVPYSKTPYSLPQIGKKLGNRDHTTILGVIRKMEREFEKNPKFKEEIEDLWVKAEVDFEDYVKSENKQIKTLSEGLQSV